MVSDYNRSHLSSISVSSSTQIELINLNQFNSPLINNNPLSDLDNNNNQIKSNLSENVNYWSRRRGKKMINQRLSLSTVETTTNESTESTNCPVDLRQQLTGELNYFFKNPMDKWRITKAFPWKLFLQFVKLIVVTIHITSIGFEMSSFITKEKVMEATLRSLIFQDWESNQELNVYPPGRGPYAVYTKANFFGNLDFAIKSIATLQEEGINLFAYDSLARDQVSPMTLVIRELSTSVLNPFDFDYHINPIEVERRVPIESDLPAGDIGWDSFNIQTYLSERNETIDFNSVNEIKLTTNLRTIFFHSLTSYYYSPACYKVKVIITYDNCAHSGQIKVSLDTYCFRQQCYGNLASSSSPAIINTYSLVTWTVFIISSISLYLCCRSLKMAWVLWSKVSKVAKDYYQVQLTIDEDRKFFDTGLLIILINDLIFFLVSFIKLTNIVDLNEDIGLANRYSLLYGLGILLTWCNLLRYLNLFERFNVVTRTIAKAGRDIFKFTLVALIIFTGYCLSGWIVLGPYHLKFATLSKTVECLFSLINADDMFATFESTRYDESTNGLVIWWFSRLYIYSFVSLFIYFIINLFITIIIEARDSVQNARCDYQKDKNSFLKKFMNPQQDINLATETK
ncbi:mucolipin-3-like [Panonychus citri]|uniref:mucolipin-3-like n=1 Tax=Panonychus citri TaxID=50023 RepID=UPI002307A671|nr:mucolipin-3-like [Panonychus citri]